jgi:hypothetical protein
VTRRLSIFVAALTLVASLFGMAAPVAASASAGQRPINGSTAPPRDTVAVNAPPVAVDDPAIPGCFSAEFGGSFPIPEDSAQQAFLSACGATANDSDSDGTIASWHVDTLPAHGAIEWDQNFPGVFGYTPDPNWSTLPGNVAGGTWVSDFFTYHVVDNQGASSNEATYRFWMAPVNDAPSFTPGPATVTVRGSAPHSAGWATAVSPGPYEGTQTVHFEITNINLHGTAGLFSAGPSIAADGTLSFTAAPGKVGTATLTVDAKDDGGLESYDGPPVFPDDTSDPVTFDIVVQADGSPDAVDDTPPAIDEDAGPTAIDVLANDTDPDLDPLLITGVTDGAKGTTAITNGGADLTFTPSPNANGSDSFTYTVDDGHGGSDTATVNITINPVNDPPTAVDDSATVQADSTANVIDVLANDSIAPDTAETLTITGTTDGTSGSVAITGGGTALTYTPAPSAFGPDSFTYTVDDGNGGTDTGTVSVLINRPPDAVNDTPAAIGEDAGATTIDVLANDSDPDLDALTITGTTDGAKGTVAITNGGADLAYTPNLNANGPDSFTYTISDGHGGSDTATVDVTINPINDAPVAVIDTLTVTEDQATASTVLVLANDTDAEGDTLTISAKTNGTKGAVVTALDGKSVTYKPNANAFGSDSFTYTVDDGHGGSTIGTVTVTITATNDRPNAVNDGVPTPFKVYLFAGAKSIPVLANDTYLPDAPETLRITKVTQGSHGKVTITGSGAGLTYTPIGTTTGIDVFKYTISDGHGGTDTASVQVTVARDTTAPKAAITGLTSTAISGSTKRRVTLTWTFTETQSGIRSELLQRRTDSGSWVTVTLSSSSVRAASFSMPRGHLYVFRVRATDRSGNVGLFVSRSIRI